MSLICFFVILVQNAMSRTKWGPNNISPETYSSSQQGWGQESLAPEENITLRSSKKLHSKPNHPIQGISSLIEPLTSISSVSSFIATNTTNLSFKLGFQTKSRNIAAINKASGSCRVDWLCFISEYGSNIFRLGWWLEENRISESSAYQW